MPNNSWKQNPEDFYTSKYQKHIAYGYGYKIVCVNDKFSKSFETYLGEDAVYTFISSMIKESNIVMKWWRNILTKNFWLLKKTISLRTLRTSLRVESVVIIILILMLK